MTINTHPEKHKTAREQTSKTKRATQSCSNALTLKEARKISKMTQVQLAQKIGVSQNRVSRIENGDMYTMSIDSLRRYITALDGDLELVAHLPSGKVELI